MENTKTENDESKYLPGGSEFDPLEPGKGLNLKQYPATDTKTGQTAGPWTHANGSEMADEIQRLEKEKGELLAALENLTDWGCAYTSPQDANSPHTLLIAARAAIAKATAAV